MKLSSKTTIGEIQAMSPAEQINALGLIWDSIANQNVDIPLSDEEKAILTRRLETEKDAPTIPWQEAREKIEKKFS